MQKHPPKRCNSRQTKSGAPCQKIIRKDAHRCHLHNGRTNHLANKAKLCGSTKTKTGNPCTKRIRKDAIRCHLHTTKSSRKSTKQSNSDENNNSNEPLGKKVTVGEKVPKSPLFIPEKVNGIHLLHKDTQSVIGWFNTVKRQYEGRIGQVIRNGPSDCDKEGFLYVFQKKGDDTFPGYSWEYFKIGRTEQEKPKDRLDQWKFEKRIVMVWKVKYNRLAERLVHLFLDHFRVFRFPFVQENPLSPDYRRFRYFTVRKESGGFMGDTAYLDIVSGHPDPIWPEEHVENIRCNRFIKRGKKREIEWFAGHESVILLVCQAIVTAVNSWS